jgi:hypothetical protein
MLLLFILSKDSLGQFIPGATKPFDVLDVTVNKALGLLGFLVSIPELSASLDEPVRALVSIVFHHLHPVSTVYASSTHFLPNSESFIQIITSFSSVVLGAVAYVLIWLASNTVNVLTLISPVPFTGAILKSIRLGLLSLITLFTIVHPYLGLILSLIIIYYAYKIAGWSLRLTVFGTVFARDYLWRTWKRTNINGISDIRAFIAVEIENVPIRTYGILRRREEGLIFSYHPWMVFPQRNILLTNQYHDLFIGKAILNPSIIHFNKDNRYTTLCYLPPRYKVHENIIATILRINPEVQDISILKGIRAAWQWIKDQVKTIKIGHFHQRQQQFMR